MGPTPSEAPDRAGAQAELEEAAQASEGGEELRAGRACQAGNLAAASPPPRVYTWSWQTAPVASQDAQWRNDTSLDSSKGGHRQEPMPQGMADPQSNLHRLLDTPKTPSETSLLLGRMIQKYSCPFHISLKL